jgi:DNA-binding beta-propeller fold protein YncE
MYIRTVILIFLFNFILFPQTFLYERSFGDFENASSFYINPVGYIFVTDTDTDEIYELDTLGNMIHSIGGYGWSNSAFDTPVDIFADALTIFVADKNNHRIQRFDKNLNFIFQVSTREREIEEESFGYPLSAVTSNPGDIFILDSENSRIIKFDLFGNFLQNFGGYDYGNYSLEQPKQLAVSMQNNIFVIDKNQIIIFDAYGNGIGKAESVEDFISIRIIFNWLTVCTEEKIYLANLKSPALNIKEVILDGVDYNPRIVSAIVFNNKLYALSKNNILVFNRM